MKGVYVLMLNVLGIIADVLGILSFIIGLPTLFTTFGIKKSFTKHIEKSDFLAEIDSKTNDLMSYYNSIHDDELYTNDLLDLIIADLEDIRIIYENILPPKIVKDIKSLEKHIKNNCYDKLYDENNKRICKTMLRSIVTKLRKEKKML